MVKSYILKHTVHTRSYRKRLWCVPSRNAWIHTMSLAGTVN